MISQAVRRRFALERVGQLVGFEIIVLRVMPVYDGVIETDFQALATDGVHYLGGEVTADEVVGIVGRVL